MMSSGGLRRSGVSSVKNASARGEKSEEKKNSPRTAIERCSRSAQRKIKTCDMNDEIIFLRLLLTHANAAPSAHKRKMRETMKHRSPRRLFSLFVLSWQHIKRRPELRQRTHKYAILCAFCGSFFPQIRDSKRQHRRACARALNFPIESKVEYITLYLKIFQPTFISIHDFISRYLYFCVSLSLSLVCPFHFRYRCRRWHRRDCPSNRLVLRAGTYRSNGRCAHKTHAHKVAGEL